jgi:hypothetical protein
LQEQQASTKRRAEAVLKWWWDAHEKHIGYMAAGGYGSVTRKKASHMTAELLLASHREAAEGV